MEDIRTTNEKYMVQEIGKYTVHKMGKYTVHKMRKYTVHIMRKYTVQKIENIRSTELKLNGL